VKALLAAVIGMGVLIVVGVVVLGVTILHRLGAPAGPAASAVLDEPAGTRIAGVAATADRLAVQLQGGGPDRVVVLDTRTGRVLARAGLAR
jgi:hypothetical protein